MKIVELSLADTVKKEKAGDRVIGIGNIHLIQQRFLQLSFSLFFNVFYAA